MLGMWQAIIIYNFKENYDPNSRKWRKTSFWAWFRPVGPKFGRRKFYFKNLASSIIRHNGQLSSCTISGKTNDPILRKLNDNIRTDRQTDESDFIGSCPTNVKHQAKLKNHLSVVFQYGYLSAKNPKKVTVKNKNSSEIPKNLKAKKF